ncbi:MAG: PTS system mannose/fructose/sorbose family transporter subunit IID [Gemmatimonadota bacterium]|nr:MAG: PTS system mannose/fructose/sorbose family transporter subunit IID [Gemmatimonadota bacterium]
MMPTRSDRIASFLRCFAIQGSWNYRTLLAGGLATAMLPLLRRVYAGDPARLRIALERHLRPFNGHPYLCPMAVTALARLEYDEESAETIARFRSALRAPLGAVGDELVWATWRPFCLLLAILLFALDGRPWVAVTFFLLLFNVGHVSLRAWAFQRGWNDGLAVGQALRNPPWGRAVGWLTQANLALLGAGVALVAWMVDPVTVGHPEIALALAASLLLGYARPALGERVAAGLVLAAPALLILLAA